MRRLIEAGLLVAACVFVGSCTAGPQKASQQKAPQTPPKNAPTSHVSVGSVRAKQGATLRDVLLQYAGRNCTAYRSSPGRFYLAIEAKGADWKLDIVGEDFVRVTKGRQQRFIPMSAISYVETKL